MPPKKKKTLVSPIVVGTVSTRSTRRQSIVNIEIPKSTRSRRGRGIAKTGLNQGSTADISSDTEHSNFEFVFESSSGSEKTDKSDTIESSDPDASFKSNSELSMENTTKSSPDSSNKSCRRRSKKSVQNKKVSMDIENKMRHSNLEFVYDSSSESEKTDRSEKFDSCDSDVFNKSDSLSTSEVKDGEESKQALLEILQDWDDDEESQEKTTENPKLAESKEFENSEFGTEGLKEIISKKDSTEVPNERETNEHDSLDDDSAVVDEQNQCKSPEVEEPMDVTFEDDNIVCVVEEIVPETDDIILTDSNIDSNLGSEPQVVSEESSNTCLINDKDSHSLQSEDRASDLVDTAADVASEESRSMSTADSNDAEVRRFFSADIHNNTVSGGIIPSNETSTSSNMVEEQSVGNDIAVSECSMDVQEEIVEETVKEQGVESAELDMQVDKEEEIQTFDSVLQQGDSAEELDTSNSKIDSPKTNLLEQAPSPQTVVEKVKDGSNNQGLLDPLEEKNSDVFTTDSQKREDILSILEDDSNNMEVASKVLQSVEEPNDVIEKGEQGDAKTMEDQLNEMNLKESPIVSVINEEKETIENKIAEMHLNEEMPEHEKSQDSSQLNSQDSTTDSESKDNSVKKECSGLAEQNNEKLKDKEAVKASEKSKSPKMNVSKNQKDPRIYRLDRPLKESIPLKVKEKKMPKEPKAKKLIPSVPKKVSCKTEKKEKTKTDKKEKKASKLEVGKSDNETDDTEVRRSSRIKFINDSNSSKKVTGRGLVKSKSESLQSFDCDVSDSSSVLTESGRSTPIASPRISLSERHSRWSKSTDNLSQNAANGNEVAKMEVDEKPKLPAKDPVVEERLKQFVHLKENSYKTDRMTCKEAKKMVCDCFLTAEDIEADEYGCGEDCLNRLLMIECGSLCPVGDRCTNKRFQRTQFAPVEVFNTEKKGLGLRAAANIPFGEFILEYVGEVLNNNEFDKRAEVYSQDKNIHYYFMALRADAIIDATMKGNISRFINHSCDPNAETQKWTVNGELRIGFFSTRTILAGEEVTFDYRFQRYGKEAQKCYCGASICRGWLGEEPDSDEDEEDEEEEQAPSAAVKEEASADTKIKLEAETGSPQKVSEKVPVAAAAAAAAKRKASKKKARVELFEEIDQLDEEIEMLLSTGLKNQAQTLKLSRLIVRAKDPQQRAKLLRVLRRGELPCRRLFLDYHGLRLVHSYMIDAQQMVMNNKKYESMRLELLQTLAVLPIPNKSMLQDSKVLAAVELWASDKDLLPLDSDSNSPKSEEPSDESKKLKVEDADGVRDQEEEIKFLANKLLEEWSNLKEVFKIPKKERIEQMKEHEREANKKFMQTQNAYEHEQDREKKNDRYRSLSARYKMEKDSNRKGVNKQGDKPSAEFLKLSKVERRKLFALQHELREEERRMKQRELWRQHEMNCMMMGTDPRLTAPFDPTRGFHCVWNPQIGQWQNYPTPSSSIYPPQTPSLPNISIPPHQIQKNMPNYSYTPPLSMNTNVAMGIPHGAIPGSIQIPSSTVLPQLPMVQYHETVIEEDPSQVKFMGPIPPPAKLPPKWKTAKDKYGRPYYYHVKLRKSQWEPPPLPEPLNDDHLDSTESESSSDTSSISSDSSSENSESDTDDTKLILEVRKQMDRSTKPAQKKAEEPVAASTSPEEKISEDDMDLDEGLPKIKQPSDDGSQRPSIDMRLKQLDLFKDDRPSAKKKRAGLCEEIIISPRTEEDKKQFKEDVKRYKANKEKLKRQKELILQQTKKQLKELEQKKGREKRGRTSLRAKVKEPEFSSDAARKIKETFRANMASTVVSSLNAYRKPDCAAGKITNTDDFKHLARKLTHFVMLKEMKHISKIEELICTDSVKTKAREYIRKYMSKFGEVYVKRNDSPDFKD